MLAMEDYSDSWICCHIVFCDCIVLCGNGSPGCIYMLHLWMVGTVCADVLCLRHVLLSAALARSLASLIYNLILILLMVLFHNGLCVDAKGLHIFFTHIICISAWDAQLFFCLTPVPHTGCLWECVHHPYVTRDLASAAYVAAEVCRCLSGLHE